MSTLMLSSPLSGWATRLEEIPDTAFAAGWVGDGVAVDPTSSELRAPCNGVIVAVHAAGHACTLRAETGAEILLHIGTNAVELRGEAFDVRVRDGQPVRQGDRLVAFDMDLLARKARSLLTAVVIVNDGGYRVSDRVQDRFVHAGEPLFAVTGGRTSARAASTSAVVAERRAQLLIRHGLHARPAATLANRARLHPGTVDLCVGDRTADAKSMVSLMGLDTRHGDVLSIRVTGENSVHVAEELAELIAGGLGDRIEPAPPERTPVSATAVESLGSVRLFPERQERVLTGAAAAPGIAMGHVVRVSDQRPEIPTEGRGVAAEEQRLHAALGGVRQQIETIIESTNTERAEILRAQIVLLDDPELVAISRREIAAGRSAAWAWRAALEAHAAVLRAAADPLVRERVGDLRDLERRVLAVLTATGSRVPADLPRDTILVGDELYPTEVADLPADRVVALCTAHGGASSHVAMLAAGMGIPAVVALGGAVLQIPEGAPLIVDGELGEVRVFPSARARAAVEPQIALRATRRRAHLAQAHEDCRTSDGERVEVMANLGRPADAAAALTWGAEGCGLLRTEFLFLDRVSPPSEDEQLARYQEIADALETRPIVIRTLDVGADKPLAYLPAPYEKNPALGLRGVRFALRHPDLLRTQIRAIIRVTPQAICRIMVPMVAFPDELRAVRNMVEEERRALGAIEPVQVGAMIEVPVAAVLADQISAEADFLSIGTNDLTQYGLAIDRDSPNVGAQLDVLHPGILRLLSQAVAGARTHGRPIAVCGAAAADPFAAALFIGLGVTTLSVPPLAVPEIKAFVRTLAIPCCNDLARRAMDLDSGNAVRGLMANLWPARHGSRPSPNDQENRTW